MPTDTIPTRHRMTLSWQTSIHDSENERGREFELESVRVCEWVGQSP
jgi:hypothetical protein